MRLKIINETFSVCKVGNYQERPARQSFLQRGIEYVETAQAEEHDADPCRDNVQTVSGM